MKKYLVLFLCVFQFFCVAQQLKKESNANNQTIKDKPTPDIQARQSGGPCYETKKTLYCNAPGEVNGQCVDICSSTKNSLCGSVTTKTQIPCGTQSSAQALPPNIKMSMLEAKSKNGDLGLAESSQLVQKYQAGFTATAGYIISDGKKQILHLYGQSNNKEVNINIPLENINGDLMTGAELRINGNIVRSLKTEKVARTGHVTLLK